MRNLDQEQKKVKIKMYINKYIYNCTFTSTVLKNLYKYIVRTPPLPALYKTFSKLYKNLKNFFDFFKENPNFQDILNWILQIPHYYSRKQNENTENSQCLSALLCLLWLVLPSPFSVAEFFLFLETVLHKIT